MTKKFLFVVALVSGITAAHAQIKFNEVQTSNGIIKDNDFGNSSDWIEIYNAGGSSVNLKGYFLTDNKDKPRKWEFKKDFIIYSKSWAIVWCDGKDAMLTQAHTNFKVSSSGEAIRLYSDKMLLIDSVKVPLVERNYSYGRTVDGAGEWQLLKNTTFNKSNSGAGGYFKGMAPQPKISLKGGWYSGAQAVTISSELPGATIRYTTDGSEPTANSPIYTGGTILADKKNGVTQKYGYNRENKTGIQNGTGWPATFTYPSNRYNGNRDFNFVLKAKVFHPDYMTSNTSGETYFINERKPSIPVISLSIAKKYLFDADSGIYIQGRNGKEVSYGGAPTKFNWAQDWSYPAHIEFYDANGGAKRFANTMTIEVFGSASRSFDLKSLAVKCKNKYENSQIDYPIFGSSGLKSYQSFILRNSGNDWSGGCFARDAIIQRIVRGQVDLETQEYQPVALYINGEYWGLMNMRERLAAEYFAGYHDYASDIDLLKIDNIAKSYEANEGDIVRYNALLAKLGPNAKNGTKTDLSANQALYNELITNWIDVDNIINYYIAQTYCNNGDWPHNNARMWRPRVENGKFRFPLYDTDFGYGLPEQLWGDNSYNAFETALSDSNDKTWSTVIFRSLLTNPDFKNEFIQRYLYMINTVYSDTRMNDIANPIESAIASERDTYTNPEWVRSTSATVSGMKSWNSNRRGTMRNNISQHARLGNGKQRATYTVQYTPSQGKVQLCGLDVQNNYAGEQMLGVPIRMTAIPAAGYQFKQWEDGAGKVLSTAQEFSYTMTQAVTVKAVFETRPNIAPGTLRINELMASNKGECGDCCKDNKTEFGVYTDWFEIYNPGSTAINIAGLYVSNSKTNLTLYQIPYGNAAATTVPANKGFLVLWASKDTYSGITHLPFKLNKDGGVIILSQKNSSGTVTIIDSLHYGAQAPDISFGRFPDGSANKVAFECPTIGKPNVVAPPPNVDNIYITEILAKNKSTLPKEETGNFADWFELYNNNTVDVDLGGLYVTNNYADLTMYKIPSGQSAKTTIKAKSYMVFWADKQIAINPTHVDFKLNAEKCQLALVQVRGSQNYIIDSVSFRNQGEDVSYGRYPNVTSPFRYLATPTHEKANVNTAPRAKVTGITINEVLAENTAILPEGGKYYDYIEFYNAGTTKVDLGGLFVSDSATYTLKYRIPRDKPAETTIEPGGWLTFYASSNASLGTRHFNFALDKAGEAVILSQVTADGLEQLDAIQFGAQSVNVSYGRYPETVNKWEFMEPTPNAKNISAASSANLKTLTSSVGKITPTVSKDVFEYVCLLPANVSTVPVISATAINDKAKVQIAQATSINGKATVIITSENGDGKAEYTVTFANDPSSDASLKSLVANIGVLEPAFSSTVYNYTLTFTSSAKPKFTAIANSPNAKVEILYGTKYSEPTIVRVTSENNTVQNYTITYKANPLELTQWVDDFSEGIGRVKQVTTHYTLTAKDGNLHIHFQRGANDPDGYFEYTLPENTVVNAAAPKDLFVTVVARFENVAGGTSTSVALKCRVVDMWGYEATNRPYEDPNANGFPIGTTVKEYAADFATSSTVDKSKIAAVRFVLDPGVTSSNRDKILIIEKIVIGPKLANVVVLSKNADLKTLTTSAGALSPAFNANTLAYTVELPAGTTTIPTISATKADAKATLQISQASSLSSEATVTVISEDLLTEKNYTVRFIVKPSVVDGYTDNILQPALSAWSKDNAAYDLSYSPGVLNVAYNRTTSTGSPFIQYNTLNGENTILNLENFPYFSVKLKSTVDATLRADLYDADGKTTTMAAQTVAKSTDYNVYTFNFKGLMASLTASKIHGVRLYFDAGATAAKSGTIVIDDMRFGRDVEIRVNAAPVITTTIPAQTREQTKPFDPINLNNYVSDDHTPVEKLVWTASAVNFNVSIVNNVATITPKSATWLGNEQITFTVTDEDDAKAICAVRFTVTELVIPVASLSFATTSVTMLLGEKRSAPAVTINPSNATTDKTLEYFSGIPSVLGIDKNTGMMTALQEGVVEITVTLASDNTKKAQCTVEVLPILAESVTAIPASMTLIEGETADLTAEIMPENTTDKTVTWVSNSQSVAKIIGNKVEAVAAGEATLIVRTKNGKEGQCKITVNKRVILVESISLPATMNLEVEETAQLTVLFTPADATDKKLTWSSSAPGIVSVTPDGKITALAIGKAEITAQTMNGKTATTTVTVKGIDPISVALSKTTLELLEGQTATLTATINPLNVTDATITWKSSSTTVATVAGGVVTALEEGKTTITAATWNNKVATCELIVKPVPAESVTLSNTDIKLDVGKTAQLTAVIQPANTSNKDLTWKIADELVASVDANGKITALAAGNTTLTVSTADGKTDVCTITVNPVLAQSVTLSEKYIELDVGETAQLTATVLPANTTDKKLTWSIADTDKAFASVDANGKITALKEGTAVLTVSTANGKEDVCTIVVKAVVIPVESIRIVEGDKTINIDETFDFTIEFTPAEASNKTILWKSTVPEVATITGGKVTALKAGVTEIQAASANGKTSTVTLSVNTMPAASITLTKNALSLHEGESATISAEILPDKTSNKTVVWETLSSEIATVDNGKITAHAIGETTITATTHNGIKAECKVTVLPIKAQSISLNTSTLSLLVGGEGTLRVNFEPANTTDKTVVWTSLSNAIATVNNGIVTANSVGKTTITATSNGIKAECEVTVSAIVETNIILNTSQVNMTEGGKETLQVTFVPANTTDKTITWAITGDKTIASVDATGTVQGLAAGTTTLTATSANGKTATCTVVVNKLLIPVESISLPVAVAVDIDKTIALEVTFEPKNASDKTITWTIDDKAIASVSTTGVVTGIKAGQTKVTARSSNNKTAVVVVTVNPMPAASITLSKTALSLVNGETATLTATVLPDKTTDKTVTWKSSNEAVATVIDGKITTLAAGTATITATAVSGVNVTASCALTVTPVVAQSVTLNRSDLSLGVGQYFNLQATVLPVNTADKSVTWSIDKPAVASIDQNGLVTAKTVGKAIVTVTTANGKTATCTLEVVAVIIDVQTVTVLDNSGKPITSLSLYVDNEYQFTAQVTPANATDKTITWTSSNPAIASVVDGKITALVDGQTRITARSNNGIIYRVDITVLPLDVEEIILKPQFAEVFVGEKVNIESTVLPAKAKDPSLTWTSSNPVIATVDKNGVVTTLAAGDVIITATSVKGITGTTSIKVKSLLPTGISIKGAEDLKIGETLQLSVIIEPANAIDKKVTWKSNNESILTVDPLSGLVTAVGEGYTTITVTATSNGVRGTSRTIFVTPVKPTEIKLSPDEITLAVGTTAPMPIVEMLPANTTDKSYTWAINKTDIASIDAQGVITAHAVGSARLTVTANSCYTSWCALKYCTITVTSGEIPVQKVIVDGNDSPLTLKPGATHYLKATVEPEGATNAEYTWEVDNPAVVSITSSGEITAQKPGTAIVTVTAGNGVKGTKTIIVSEYEAEKVVIVDGSLLTSLFVGESKKFEAYVLPAEAVDKTITWAAKNGYVSVDANGVVTALSKGMDYITAIAANGITSSEAWVTVADLPQVADVDFGSSNKTTLDFNETKQIEFTVTPSNGDKSTIQWVSSDETIATVDAQGIIHTLQKEGQVTITAISQYGKKTTITFTVKEYFEAPTALRDTLKVEIKHGGEFKIMLQEYFLPYKGETLTYDGIIPPSETCKISTSTVSDGTTTVEIKATTSPTWFGSETHIAVVKNNGGKATMYVEFTVKAPVGIAPVPSPLSSINAYPTVTSTYTTLSISSAEPADYTLSVYDIEGKQIETHRLSVNKPLQKIIDFTNLPRGIYTCVLSNDNEKQSVKIVVE